MAESNSPSSEDKVALENIEIKKTKLSNEIKDLNNQIIMYARKELCIFNQKYQSQICHIMGSIV